MRRGTVDIFCLFFRLINMVFGIVIGIQSASGVYTEFLSYLLKELRRTIARVQSHQSPLLYCLFELTKD